MWQLYSKMFNQNYVLELLDVDLTTTAIGKLYATLSLIEPYEQPSRSEGLIQRKAKSNGKKKHIIRVSLDTRQLCKSWYDSI